MSNHATPTPPLTDAERLAEIARLRHQLGRNFTRLQGLRHMYSIADQTPGLELHAEGLVEEVAEIEQDSSLVRRLLIQAGDDFFQAVDRPHVDWVLMNRLGETVASGPMVEAL